MRILIADDDRVGRQLLAGLLTAWNHEPIEVTEGERAWEHLCAPDAPALAILDWEMPGVSGIELCRRIRGLDRDAQPHVILLTARKDGADIVDGLSAGAGDYIVKPFNAGELRARIQVGVRIVELQQRLRTEIAELKRARGSLKVLEGLLPICGYCKKIRDDRNYWQQLETYISDHSHAQFSHGICPSCYEAVVATALKG